MKYTSIPSAQTVINYCKAAGIENIIISPGSRNAPLTLGFTEDPFFECYSLVDERSAAFFALGLSQQLRHPTAIVCTSGSAVLNYYPAVAEAFYSNIPLLVLTADRPTYKIDIGDGQTIRQDQVLHRHCQYSASLLQDPGHATETYKFFQPSRFKKADADQLQKEVQEFNEKELKLAMQTLFKRSGPVHINIPFEEPLYELRDNAVVPAMADLEIKEKYPLPPDMEELAENWGKAGKILLIVGVLPPGTISEGLQEWLASLPQVLVLTETTSNLHHPSFFSSIDSLMAPLELAENSQDLFLNLQPDLLISIGGMIVSKKVKAFLRTYRPNSHWHIGGAEATDTFFALSRHIPTNPDQFLEELKERTGTANGNYRDTWLKRQARYQERRETYLETIDFSDFKASARIFKELPEPLHLQLANSSTIRYAQLFPLKKGVEVYCNRGTSGIEGSTSTAVGAALKKDCPTLLLSGDLSFLYDTNGLWNKYLRPDFRIIVINNQGGGIFRILPGVDSTPNFAEYFETVQELPLEPVCNTYGLEYRHASSDTELKEQLDDFFSPSVKPRLLEVSTPRLKNNKILLRYFDFIS